MRMKGTLVTKKLRVHVISHTHWDREWYFPFERFRFQLVRVLDRLLDLLRKDAGFKYFILDGQTSCLEDYLEIRPERRAELARRIEQGRIVIGPWYVMPDEFLVSAESLIRNLQMGKRVGKAFGPVSTAGYLPDPFGHLAQLPQILNGFGIDSLFFMRGMVEAESIGTEFRWQAPDGKSELFGIWIRDGYGNASLLGYPFNWGDIALAEYDSGKAIEDIERALERIASHSRCGSILFYNGADHLDAQVQVPAILREARKRFPDMEFIHSTHERYLDDVRPAWRKLKVVRGELRSGRYHYILSSVLSARMYLKRMNRDCEELLERWAEPLSSLVGHLARKDNRPFLLQAWKYLLQNHPHDSICGCSVDEVHRENVTRFEKAGQLADSVAETELRNLLADVDTYRDETHAAIAAWNPLPAPRRGGLQAEVLLPENHPRQFRVVNAQGEEIPQQIEYLGNPTVVHFTQPSRSVLKYQVTLDTPAEGIGYETFWTLSGKPRQTAGDRWAAKATIRSIETEYYKIRFRGDGSFDLYDKSTRGWHRNLLVFEDTEDTGDEYDYSPGANSLTLTTGGVKARLRIVERGPLYVTYEIVHRWTLPAGFDFQKGRRSAEKVPAVLRTRMRVYRSARRIELVTELENRAKDHRLRVHFTGPRGTERSWADGHFGIIGHPVKIESTPKHLQEDPVTFHARYFAALEDGQYGVAVLGRHLTEYEAVHGPRGARSLAVTLLRAVGKLSRDKMITRSESAGPLLDTPEAQCLGPQRFEYALLPFAGGDPAEDVTPEAESFASPVRLISLEVKPGKTAPERRFLRADNASVVYSAWKPAESGPGSVLRFYNPSKKPRQVCLELAGPMVAEGLCDLKEDPVKSRKMAKKKRKISLRLKGYAAVSVKIKNGR